MNETIKYDISLAVAPMAWQIKMLLAIFLAKVAAGLRLKLPVIPRIKQIIYGYTDWAMSEFITREGSSNGGDSGSGSTTEDVGCKGGTVLPHTVLLKRKPNIFKQ